MLPYVSTRVTLLLSAHTPQQRHACYCLNLHTCVMALQDGEDGVGAKNIVTPPDTAAIRTALYKHICGALGDDAETKLPVFCGDRK